MECAEWTCRGKAIGGRERAGGRDVAPTQEDAPLAHEVSVLMDLGQQLAQAEARRDRLA